MSAKRICSKADLAINGAPPAFDQPLHVGRPNIGNREAFLDRVNRILDSDWLTNDGPAVHEFERRIADHLGVRHCIAVTNGTIALEIAIRALGLSDEVILPSWTFIATAHAVQWQGIKPVFADINPATHNLDPAAVRSMITPHTTGIIGVHLWGRAAPIDELQDIADEHGLALLFDAGHAFGSSYKGRNIGSFGKCEAFSFHATKALSCMEGGAITTNDDGLAETARLMRNFGFMGYDNVVHPGINGKMTEVCAAMGLTTLDAYEDIISSNHGTYAAYKQALANIPGVSLLDYDPVERNSHQYVVMELGPGYGTSRDEIVAALQAENVLARKYFWPGCHRMQPYRDLFPHASRVLPHTDEVAARVVVLPTGPSLPDGAVTLIADVLRRMASTSPT